MVSHSPRAELERLTIKHGTNYAALSRLLGRNSAYVQQFVKRGVPGSLSERDCRLLADFFGVSEVVLGGSPDRQTNANLVLVPRLDVRASAGHGALADGEAQLGHYGFDRRWLQQLNGAANDNLSIVRVMGDSMAPTLQDGDDILVQHARGTLRPRDGIYVLQRDDELLVKRVALGPVAGTLDISSDNPAYPSWRGCDPSDVTILGRVIWSARKLV